MIVKEFLGKKSSIEFISVNPVENPKSRQLWIDAGSPPVPAVKVGDRVVSILHVSQLYSLLGLDMSAEFDEQRYAWDLLTMQQSWLRVVGPLDWETLHAPTPARNRNIRELVYDVFQYFPKLERAWSTNEFVTDPFYALRQSPPQEAADSVRAADAIARHIEKHISSWQAFLVEHYSEENVVSSPSVDVRQEAAHGSRSRGSMPFAGLLAFVRNHTALHLRQTTVFLDRSGIQHPSDGLEAFDLELPDDVYGEGADLLGPRAHADMYGWSNAPSS